MKSSSLQCIEKELPMLSQDEQLWLIERVAQQLRKAQQRAAFAKSVEEMANDPEIQAENRRIAEEFAVTDGDGLAGL
jgi:hypothetical protein